MPYRSLDTIMRWLRLALVGCAAVFLNDASKLLAALPEYEMSRSRPRDTLFSWPSKDDPMQELELVVLIAVIVLLTLFFERAYRNLGPLGLARGLLWRTGGRAWRALTGCWCALLALAAVSIAGGNQLHAGLRTIDQSQFRDSLEAAGELATACTALLTAVVVSVISLQQARRAVDLGIELSPGPRPAPPESGRSPLASRT